MMIKRAVKDSLAQLDYWLYRTGIRKCNIQTYSIDETIDTLISSEKSMIRFGDGEITMIRGRSLKLQQVSPEIAEGLKRILGYPYEDIMITIPEIFGDLRIYRKESRQFWKDHLLFSRRVYQKYCNPEKKYYNTSVSRFYYALSDEEKKNCDRWVRKIREIWKDRDIVIVEGERTHNGVGNDLFDTAGSIERIIGPASDAYVKRNEILECCKKHTKDKLFLVSLGVTAKFLVEDLYKAGYRALDIGNLDMEYEWYLHKAAGKEPVKKHSVVGKEANEQAGFQQYLQEITAVVK